MTDEELLKAVLSGSPYLPREVVEEISGRGSLFGRKLLELIRNIRLWHTEEPGRWAVVHAIRLVGSMKLRDAVMPLTDAIFLAYSTKNEDAMDDLPVALAQIGDPAIRPLTSIMEDRALEVTIRCIAASALEGIAVLNPDQSGEILDSFRKTVKSSDELSAMRSHAITILAHFRAAEDRSLIKTAMANMPMMLDISTDDVDEYFAQNEDSAEWDQFAVDLLEYYDDELV
jgi:hypothetical protein